mmetsp:Transcript_81634/g.189611  ORF Transcript_81634/g.189611 Transcript_81634/m.189611 type:complete len:206 (+) Transcript_81634:528-1145(+)
MRGRRIATAERTAPPRSQRRSRPKTSAEMVPTQSRQTIPAVASQVKNGRRIQSNALVARAAATRAAMGPATARRAASTAETSVGLRRPRIRGGCEAAAAGALDGASDPAAAGKSRPVVAESNGACVLGAGSPEAESRLTAAKVAVKTRAAPVAAGAAAVSARVHVRTARVPSSEKRTVSEATAARAAVAGRLGTEGVGRARARAR